MSFIIVVYNCAHVLPEDFRENFIGSGRAKTHIQWFREKEVSVGKKLLIKISMGKLLNEMGNYPFASPLIAPLKSADFLSG